MDLDVICEDARWDGAGLTDLVNRSVVAVCQYVSLGTDMLEISVLGCNDAQIASLNADFRDKPTPTNVLSWPAENLVPPELPAPGPDGVVALGDIAIACETCLREAAEQKKPFENHVTHLIVHGVLHLLGYDHIDDADAARMEAIEVEILGKLGVSDPYLHNPSDEAGGT